VRITIAGAGPAGTTAALLLARAGYEVTLVDRDGGPPTGGQPWSRVGVMQFNLPHTLRSPGHNLLMHRLPDVHQRLLDAGALVFPPDQANDAFLHVRRSVLERVLWACASEEPAVRRITGHVASVEMYNNVARGVVVDGRLVGADLVVDASGRRADVSKHLRPPAEGGDCGFAYACRLYQLKPAAAPGPLNGGPGYMTSHHGFLLMVFLHEAGMFTVLIVRRSTDRDLVALRDEPAFTAAIRALPAAAAWTDPGRCSPIEPVRAGAGLVNRYQAQPTGVRGLIAIGDASCTTTRRAPAGSRSACSRLPR
jgi:2-polyprenyl-6-methoxyphenol hydroxylase-like FAD-dependent oxidoreductase